MTLARYLAAAGADVHLVVLDAKGPLLEHVPKDVELHDLGHRRLRTALPSLVRVLRRLAPAGVFSTIGYTNLAIAAIRPLLHSGTRIFLREANLPSLSLPHAPAGTLIKFGSRLLYPSADMILCSSRRMQEELLEHFGIRSDRSLVLSNPVDIDMIREKAAPILRRPGSGPRFVASGRLVHQKGFDRLIDAISQTPLPAQLTILGDGPDHVALRKQVAERNLSDRIDFAGFIATPWPYYAGADALVVASRWEGMPNSALEALACGTPVIATPEAGGIVELAEELGPGAVRIAEHGPSYWDAMRAVQPQATPHLRPCLLPERFRASAVAKIIVQLST